MPPTSFDKLPSDGGYGGIRVSGNHLSLTATGDGTKGADGYANNGDINIQGSNVSAKVVDLNAARDVNLTSATNTDLETSSSSSSGWAVGANIGVSASGSMGISVFANANKGKGNANGNGVTHTETQINASDTLNVHSGRDANLIGAQAHGNTVNADIGRDLTITSEQDSSNYNSKQTNMSAGVEIPVYGVGSASASFNMSRQKIDSNYNSVNEQSGIYAGSGGFNVKVNGHTQLNGGAMVSTAPADKNTLDTGSLSVTSIDNHAQYTANNSGIGISTGNLTDIAKGALMAQIPQALNGGEDANSTTQSAISPANVTIGGKAATAEQLKDVATTANANSLANNFDVQKVQDQMALASTVGDVGALATNVVSTAMQRSEYVKRDEALKAAEDNLKATDPVAWQTYQAHPSAQALVDIEFNQALQTNPVLKAEYEALPKDKQDTFVQDQINQGKGFGAVSSAEAAWHQTQNQYGPGSDFSRTAQALSGLAAGLASGNNGQALSNLTQPFLASAIGTYFDKLEEDPVTHQIVHQADTTAERLLAHAAAGAVVAYFSGNNAASGATGAVSGEAMAMIVHQQMYDGKPVSELTQAEKENIRAVATLASGLAGALQGGSFETAATSAAAGYNAAVNNSLNARKVDKNLYQIVSGTIDGDNTIYVIDDKTGKRTGQILGKTLTPYSGFNEEGYPVKSSLNTTDYSGIRFLNNPEMLNDMLSPYTKYFPNARSGEKYDFKSQYPEKGDVAYNRFVIFNNVVTPTIYATARDIGNFSAGAAAGVNNWSWIKTRSFFDGYNAISRHGKQWSESPVSQSAERAGWEYGRTQQKNK